jgi:hypothetical protein
MQTFTHGDLGQIWSVTSFDERFVFAKKVVDGKTGRGRPSKFNRSEVESLIEGGLVVETQPELNVGTPINTEVQNETSEVTEDVLPEVTPEEVVFVKLD